MPCKEMPMPFEALTKIKGDHTRHIEQLWDEINKLKERMKLVEEMINNSEIPNDSVHTIPPRLLGEELRRGEDKVIKEMMNNPVIPDSSNMLENMKRRIEWCLNDRLSVGKFYSHDHEIDILSIIINAAEWEE